MSVMHGWGRVPRRLPQEQVHVESCAILVAALRRGGVWTPRGLGRSYGDAALGSAVLHLTGLRFLREYDAVSGEIECEAGMSLGALLDFLLPRRRCLAVLPGTRWVTVGGAIAADVHGKNHHHAGCFSAYVVWLDLMGADGRVQRWRPGEPAFHATCGGMGLTGVITAARLRTIPVAGSWMVERTTRADGLEALFEALDESHHHEYVVGWLDCLARGARLGRGVVLAADHSEDSRVESSSSSALRVPCDAPAGLLGPWSVRAFNALYLRARSRVRQQLVPIGKFFFPLDGIEDWNRLYGSGGFVQHQCVLPPAGARTGVRAILARCAASGRGSMLAVLKRLGSANANLLSFPMDGYTLALDFRYSAGLPEFLSEIDAIVLEHGGRLYLAKDSCMSQASFRAGYPRIAEFAAWRAANEASRTFGSDLSVRLGI